jgi:L-alanine-DL-glutamate epimerase-like enolase superfamily enzyme
MNLAAIEICDVRIPFRFRYGHASAKHNGVQSVLCVARDRDGNEGYGEAVPRSYVTGETVASIMQTLPGLIQKSLPANTSFFGFLTSIAGIETEFPKAVPSCAICALETAVTDLVARQHKQSVTDLLGGAKKSPLTYTASIGISSPAKLAALLLLYRAMGLRTFKVKVSDDIEADRSRLKLIRRILGAEVKLFADANCAWEKEAAARRIEQLVKLGVWAIEEPLRISTDGHDTRESALTEQHFIDNAWLQQQSPIPLIADESLISLRGAHQIVEHSAFQIFNIRLSKCGGYRRATQFAELARGAGLNFSLGAMVGESPILATAGAAWAASHPEHLYVQGHSHRLLHGQRFVDGCPALGRRGIYEANSSPGSGLNLNRDALERVVKERRKICIQ